MRDSFPAGSDRFAVSRAPDAFELDLDLVWRSIRSRMRAIAIAVALGVTTGVAVVLFVPPRFDGRAMVLIRTRSMDPMAAVRSKVGPLAELMPGALGGSSDEELATELALLSSRAAMGAVVDSLRLQVIARSPSRIPPRAIVDSVRLLGRFKPAVIDVSAGETRIGANSLWAPKPARVKILDHEDAINELDDRLVVRKISGNAIEIRYKGRDSLSAATVPNMLADVYMSRRLTVDRGLNQRRLEFLLAKSDSVRLELRRAADVLVGAAERAGIGASPEIGGKAMADEAGILEGRIAELRATERALDSLISAPTASLNVRRLAGFPQLLLSPALNEIIGQMAKVETDRTIMLARVPETNPVAIALGRAHDSLAAQMMPIAASYLGSIAQARASLDADLSRLRIQLARLPSQSAAVLKEQAEVTRLAQLNAGMGAQVLEARLAALLEGGDVRLVDHAIPPRRVTFPRPMLTIALCTMLGLIGGLLFAVWGVRTDAIRTGQA